jgi:peptidoglycan/LPS O-acetylase OafA/YrhL
LNLAQAFDPKRNAFAFLRMCLATAVIFSHCFILGGFGGDPLAQATNGRVTIGLAAVAMFFVLSGFLITRSALDSPSIGRFLWHRFLRIFPGYWVALTVCAFVFAPIFAGIEYGAFLRVFSAPWDRPQAYWLGNALMFHANFSSISSIMTIHPASIAHLLGHNPSPWVINGSLWSLPYECACYAAVAALTLTRLLRRHRTLVLILFVSLIGLHEFDCLAPREFNDWFPCRGFGVSVMLGLYFASGGTAFLFREKIPFSAALFVSCLIALVVSLLCGAFVMVAPLVLPYAFLWLALALPITRFDAKGDFSYGTYIYAFPVQQALALLHIQRAGFTIYLLCSLAVTLLFAVLSYRFIEEPALRLKNVQARWFRSKSESPMSPAKESSAAAVAQKA